MISEADEDSLWHFIKSVFSHQGKCETSEITFKYSAKKLFIRMVISLILLGVFLLLIMNEPLWRFRPYLSESAAYILFGRPNIVHYMSPETLAEFRQARQAESRFMHVMEDDILYIKMSFLEKYGCLMPYSWPLEAVRRLMLNALIFAAAPIFRPRIFTNKRVFARLTKTHFYYYNVWPIIPFAYEISLTWDRILDAELKLSPIFGDQIVIHYIDTESNESKENDGKKDILSIPIRYGEDSKDVIFRNIYKHIKTAKAPIYT